MRNRRTGPPRRCTLRERSISCGADLNPRRGTRRAGRGGEAEVSRGFEGRRGRTPHPPAAPSPLAEGRRTLERATPIEPLSPRREERVPKAGEGSLSHSNTLLAQLGDGLLRLPEMAALVRGHDAEGGVEVV